MLIKLDEPIGANDGTVDGHHYYSLSPKHGVLANPTKVTKIERTITFNRGRQGTAMQGSSTTPPPFIQIDDPDGGDATALP